MVNIVSKEYVISIIAKIRHQESALNVDNLKVDIWALQANDKERRQ